MDIDGLSPPEQALVEAMARGEIADLRRQPIRASVLRDLILEARPGWVLPPAGLRMTRAIVQGCLDLDGCSIAKPMQIRHSRFEGTDGQALIIRDTRMKRLGIHSSTIEGAIIGDRLDVESGLFLGGGRITGLVQMRGASVAGALVLEGNEFGDGKTALLAAGLRLSGPLILRKAQAAGLIALPRAAIGAGIYAEDAIITAEATALECDSARIEGDILLDGARLKGALRLSAARIGGRVAANRAEISVAPGGDAVTADGLDLGQSLELADARLVGALRLEGAYIAKEFSAERLDIEGGSTAIGADIIRIGGNWDLARARLVGLVSMPGIDVNGQLRLTEARLYGTDIALRGDGARIRGGCFMSRALVFGLVRFPAAEIGNQLRLRGAALKVDFGPALIASGTSFGRDVELGGDFQSVGAIVLDQASIDGTLDLRGSRIASAAVARLQAGAPNGETRTLSGAERVFDERALSLVDADVGRLQMPVTAEHRPRGIVDLSRAHVGSLEDYAAAWPPAAVGKALLPTSARGKAQRATSADGRDIDHLVLDGLVCEHLANPSGAPPTDPRTGPRRHGTVAKARIAWLDGQSERDTRHRFKPQAWIALGERLEAQGYHDDARELSIARRRRERRSSTAGLGARWQGRLLDALALYGFNPWRTVLWMALVVVGFAALWSWAARHCTDRDCFEESVFVVMNRDSYTPDKFQAVYPGFNALAYSFDLALPFVSFGYGDHWRPNQSWRPFAEMPLPDVGLFAETPSVRTADGRSVRKPPSLTLTVGGLLYVASIIEQILGLVLASLIVTGFTGILQKGE